MTGSLYRVQHRNGNVLQLRMWAVNRALATITQEPGNADILHEAEPRLSARRRMGPGA